MFQFLRDLSVKVKAILGSAVLIGSVGGLGLFALQALDFGNQRLRDFRSSTLPRVQTLRNIAYEAMEAQAQVFRLVALTSSRRADIVELAARRNGIDGVMTRVQEGLKAVSARSDLTESQRQTILTSLTNWENYVKEASEVLDSVYYDANFGVVMLPELDKHHDAAAREVAALSRLFSAESASTIATFVAAGESGMRVMGLWVLASVGLVVLVIWAMTSALIKPITAVTRAMSAVAAGADAEIPPASRKDELGEMLAAVATFKANLERRQDELRMQNVRFDAALENMAQGLCMFDKDERLIVCNGVYKHLYRLPDDLCRPGTSLADIFAHRIALGFYAPDVTLESMLTANRARNARAEANVSHVDLQDGRTIAIAHKRMQCGGYVATHEDVTDLLRTQKELAEQSYKMEAVVNNVPQGLVLYDAEDRLIACNKPYADLYGLDVDDLKPGITQAEIRAKRKARGTGIRAQLDAAEGLPCEVLPNGGRRSYNEIDDGRIIAITRRALTGGMWVATCEDVTARLREQRETARQNELFDTALSNIVQGLAMYDGESRLIVWNDRYAELYGIDKALLKPGMTQEEVHALRKGSSKLRELTEEDGFPREELAHGLQKFNLLQDGRIFSISHRRMANGGWCSTHEDITAQVRDQKEIARQNYRFHLLINGMAQGLCMFGGDRRLIACNEPYLRLYGLSADEIKPGVTIEEVIRSIAIATGSTDNLDKLVAERLAVIAEQKPQAHTRELSDGRVIAIRHVPMEGGGWVATHDDVTDQRRAEARIAHMARHDALTDLPNRVLFREHMDEALAGVRRRGGPVAVLCLDLDHFKQVNDTLGHPVGDALLKAVAVRLQGCLRERDALARLGGDEFAIIQFGSGAKEVSTLAQRIVESIASPFEIDGHQVLVGTSIGIAIAPDDGLDADQLLKNADMALYKAKADGRGTFRFFEGEMDARAQQRRVLEMELRSALQNGEFEVCYQPLVMTKTHDIEGFEALVRWRHPAKGIVPPSEFIPVAEDTGLIVALGEWVLRQACTEAATWGSDIKLAVNISSVQFRSKNLLQTVVSALASSGLAASRLELEITESVMLQDSDGTLATLKQLRELGVGIAMDDFGTGYSSLSYLHRFPITKIKIDRSFISSIGQKKGGSAVVRAVVEIARSLRMTATAEGVETEHQLAKLCKIGCNQAQGYLFSPPVTAAKVRELLPKLRNVA